MSKIIDITDKLTFEENPRIRVKDVEIELNANALDFYETLGMMNEKSTNMDELTLRLAATPADVDKIKALKLSVKDFNLFARMCLETISGADTEGEALTPAMT